MKVKSLKLNAILNTIKTVTSLLFPLVTFPYVSRILLPDGIGKVNFANSIISYFALFASLGIGTYASREAAKVRDDKQKLSKLVKEMLLINFISTIVSYVFFIISLFAVSKFYDYKLLLCVCSLTIVLNTIGVDWLNSAMEDYAYITLRTILFQLVSLSLIFLIVKTKDDYIKYAGISVLSSAGANVLNFAHSRKYVKYFAKTEKLELKKHIKPIFILFASSIAISIFTIMDTSMLGFLSTSTEVGYYSAASKLVRMVRDLFPAVYSVLFARFSYYYSQNDETSYNDLAKKTSNFILCFSFPVVSGFIILAKPVLELLCGEAYLPAISSVITLSPLILISSCSGFLGGVLMITQGKDKQYLYTTIVAAFIDVVLNFALIKKFGAFGASLATLLTEVFIIIVYITFTKNILLKMHIWKSLFQYLLSTLLMTVLVFVLTIFIENRMLKIFVSAFAGALFYALCLNILHNEYFITTKKELLAKLKKK